MVNVSCIWLMFCFKALSDKAHAYSLPNNFNNSVFVCIRTYMEKNKTYMKKRTMVIRKKNRWQSGHALHYLSFGKKGKLWLSLLCYLKWIFSTCHISYKQNIFTCSNKLSRYTNMVLLVFILIEPNLIFPNIHLLSKCTWPTKKIWHLLKFMLAIMSCCCFNHWILL